MNRPTTFSTILFLLASANHVFGSDDPETKATLRGIPSVGVLVENLSPDVVGLTRDVIQTDTELSLRKTGIKVEPDGPFGSYLYIHVHVVKADDLYAYNISVSYVQAVMVKVNSVSSTASTWHVGGLGMVRQANMNKMIRAAVQDLVDKFLNAYLSVNPK